MTAQDDLTAALRQIVQPVLKSEGYKGSVPNWARVSERGDTAIVQIQKSQMSTGNEVLFTVEYGVVSGPKMAHVRGTWSSFPAKPSLGLADWRARLHAKVCVRLRGMEPCWSVSDESTAHASAEDVAEQLRATALLKLAELLDRRNLIDLLRANGRTASLALVLADDGPGEDLDRALDALDQEAKSAMREDRARNIEELMNWARLAAEKAGEARVD
jgi:Domain of unknown function (DUF4304)